MLKRLAKYGKWAAILYVTQAAVGAVVGVYLYWSGVGALSLDLIR